MKTSTSSPSSVQLLIACVRPGAEAGREDAVAAQLSEATDWDRLLQLATHHRVRGPFCRGIRALPPDRVPPNVQEFRRSTARAAMLRNKFLIGEMGRVQSLLADDGIRSISFKGPVLAYTVYRDGRYRWTRDIDLMVHPDAFSRATRLLTRDEYRSFWDLERSALDRFGAYLKQQNTLVRGNAFAIDLHASLTPIVHASGAEFEDLWGRSVQQTVEGTRVRTLRPRDRLLMLCQQAIKNRWNRLKYTCDIAECLWATEDLDWRALWDEAQRTSQSRLLLTNLCIAREIFQTPLPDFLRTEIEQNRRVQKIGTWGTNKLQSGLDSVGVRFSERVWLYWTIQDTVSHSVHYAGYSVVRNLWEQLQNARSALRGS
nr:nucleotidyltransferase family protein [Salinibacter ruber]